MTTAEDILLASSSVLLVDWPTRDVPDTLARAGYHVTVKGGPEPDDYSVYEVVDDQVVVRRTGRPPDRAELVYTHRPLSELPGIVAMATALGALAIWYQSGVTDTGTTDGRGCWLPDEQSRQARALVAAAGMAYVDDTYLADRVREVGHASVQRPEDDQR